MNIVLWVVQLLLAAAFLGAGSMKLGMPIETLLENGMTFVSHMPEWLVRFIGLSEVAGAIGLVVPAATRIRPGLTPLAAGGLVTVMVLAAFTHVMLGEFGNIVPNIVLGSLAAFVVWGRLHAAPIAPRAGRLAQA